MLTTSDSIPQQISTKCNNLALDIPHASWYGVYVPKVAMWLFSNAERPFCCAHSNIIGMSVMSTVALFLYTHNKTKLKGEQKNE